MGAVIAGWLLTGWLALVAWWGKDETTHNPEP